jgi:glycosyltransferase involved in cell wall biosynthesis
VAKTDANYLFVINSLAGGGAERVMTTLLARSKDRAPDGRLHLALLDNEPAAYTAPDFVTVHQLDARGSQLRSILQLLKLVRTLRPRLMLSFLTRANVAAVAVGRLTGVRCVISERVDTASHFSTTRLKAVKLVAVRTAYGLAERIIAVSAGVADSLVENFGIARDKIAVIENPVDVEAIRAKGAEAPSIALETPFVVGVGRLVPNKNFRLLIEAFAASGAPGKLVILGEGPERPALTQLIADLGLTDRVSLPGFAANPFAVVSRAEIFVLPSNAEGFPNGLLEGMSLGVPVISTNCASGPSEVLTDQPRRPLEDKVAGIYGILTPVDRVDAMASALQLLQDPELRRRYGALAEQRARMYTPEMATSRYWSVLEPDAQA